jgi:hypothetical protein
MKTIIFVVICLISLSCNSQKNKKMIINPNVYAGMSIDEFDKVYPNIVDVENQKDSQITIEQEWYGFQSGWAFQFKSGKLEWYMWDCYVDDINQENFNKCLSITDTLKSELISIFGQPCQEIVGDKTFKDPYIQTHWGYEVVQYKWKTDKMKFKLIFNFFGGKGMYNFLVKMEFYDLNYEFFD